MCAALADCAVPMFVNDGQAIFSDGLIVWLWSQSLMINSSDQSAIKKFDESGEPQQNINCHD
jgi:hypothetical protein